MQQMFWLWIILIHICNRALHGISHKGINIGNSCLYDVECTLGNGGEYSKCNQALKICICTVNHLGEDQCLPDSAEYVGFCRRRELFECLKKCQLECCPIGTKIWKDNEDWNGEVIQPFSQTIPDKKTSVCYDPERAMNTVPDGFEVKTSKIPNAGLGTFTNKYIEANTFLSVFKGTFEPNVDAVSSIYSWTIHPPDGSVYWIDSTNVALSNWLRYMNTPTTAAMENVVAIDFQGNIFYKVFRSVKPGTELLIWYGEEYRKYLGLKPFKHPSYYTGMPEYVGGKCTNNGAACEHDKNTICADGICMCRSGTREREGICFQDEKFGGQCIGSDGSTCKHDSNAECQRGICVCKNHSILANDRCVPDETLGGRCAGSNGQKCLLDNKIECFNGLCKCMFGTRLVEGICVTDETFDGSCSGNDGDECELDENAECLNGVCVCKNDSTAIDGVCIKDDL